MRTIIMKLAIKSVKPFTELSLNVKGIPKTIIVGVKSYEHEELIEVRNHMTRILESDKLDKTTALLEKLEKEGDKTSDEFYEERAELTARQRELLDTREEALLAFYKAQILFLRNVEITIDDKDLVIKDTRDTPPIESLWANEEEALVVLLDTFLSYIPFRDSLFGKLTQAVFNPTESGKEKNS